MSERDDSGSGGCLILFLFVLILMTMFVNHYQADYIRDLQRRVGQLERAK